MEDRSLWGRYESIPVGQYSIRQFGRHKIKVQESDGESVIPDFVWQGILI
jgi:hypothetical protein